MSGGSHHHSSTSVREISALHAWNMLHQPKTILVDVRTEQELPEYGQPDLTETGGESFLIPWRLAPDYHANPHFLTQLKQVTNSNDTILFLCKAGGRSYEAASAALQSGFTQCYNVVDGMEGENGWKASDLAWGRAAA